MQVFIRVSAIYTQLQTKLERVGKFVINFLEFLYAEKQTVGQRDSYEEESRRTQIIVAKKPNIR
jgi:hypothetical protein